MEYQAPESISGKAPLATDFWSLGVFIYEMLMGNPPFITKADILGAKVNLKKDPSLSDEAEDILTQLLQKDPTRRLSNVQAAKYHPFFAGIDWEELYHRATPPPDVVMELLSPPQSPNFNPEFLAEPTLGNNPPLPQPFEGFTFLS